MDRGTSRAGYVLVGGASSRMGRDKAQLPLDGKTLLEHVAAAVAEAAGSVTLVGAPERYAGLGLRLVPDSRPGCGPLAGIHAALTDSRAAWNLIVACDMPLIDAPFLRSLLDAAESCGADCLIPNGPSGRPEPLCAVYHARCATAIGGALDLNVRKITGGLAGLRVAAWSVPDSRWFRNVNTPQEWDRHLNG